MRSNIGKCAACIAGCSDGAILHAPNLVDNRASFACFEDEASAEFRGAVIAKNEVIASVALPIASFGSMLYVSFQTSTDMHSSRGGDEAYMRRRHYGEYS